MKPKKKEPLVVENFEGPIKLTPGFGNMAAVIEEIYKKAREAALKEIENQPSLEPRMTLRQWYAGLAMQGLIIRGELEKSGECGVRNGAFRQADAMLEESSDEPERES